MSGTITINKSTLKRLLFLIEPKLAVKTYETIVCYKLIENLVENLDPPSSSEVISSLSVQLDLAKAVELLNKLIDPDSCYYDHHDNCQQHNLHSRPCPHEVAKAFLKEMKDKKEKALKEFEEYKPQSVI